MSAQHFVIIVTSHILPVNVQYAVIALAFHINITQERQCDCGFAQIKKKKSRILRK